MEKQIDKIFKLSIKNSLVIVVMYYLLTAIGILPFTILSETAYVMNKKILQALVIVLGTLIINIITIRLILRKINKNYKFNFKISYIKKFNLKILLCTLLFIGGYYLWYQSSIGIITGKIPLPQIFQNALKKSTIANYYSQIIIIAIIAPIFEEIIMRGIILEGFLNKYKPVTAIIISALIFGLIHLYIPQIINATLLGIALGFIYYKTSSLLLCISAHMLNNIIGIILYTNFSNNILIFFIGTVIFIISGVFFMKYIKQFSHYKNHIKIENNLNNTK